MRGHIHRFRVIYGDTDMMGIVYYANYLRYFEAGRNEFLREVGIQYRDWEAIGFSLPVASASVRYHAPARYDDVLTLETQINRIRFSSLGIEYKLLREADQTLIATGETVHACLGPSGKVSRLPDQFRKVLVPTLSQSAEELTDGP